jgi:hypothetical protein
MTNRTLTCSIARGGAHQRPQNHTVVRLLELGVRVQQTRFGAAPPRCAARRAEHRCIGAAKAARFGRDELDTRGLDAAGRVGASDAKAGGSVLVERRAAPRGGGGLIADRRRLLLLPLLLLLLRLRLRLRWWWRLQLVDHKLSRH